MNDTVGGERQVSNDGAAVGTDAARGKEGADGTLGGLRGPWMNVPMRRKPKFVFKAMGNKGSGSKSQGSCFDVFREVDENVGVEEVVASGCKTQAGPFKQSVDLGPKV